MPRRARRGAPMKAFALRLGLLLVAVFLGCSGGTQEPRVAGLRSNALSSNRARKVTILHVNDSHSTLDAVGPKDANLDGMLGGMTKAATVIERVRRSAPDALLLHAGDVFEGTSSSTSATAPAASPSWA